MSSSPPPPSPRSGRPRARLVAPRAVLATVVFAALAATSVSAVGLGAPAAWGQVTDTTLDTHPTLHDDPAVPGRLVHHHDHHRPGGHTRP